MGPRRLVAAAGIAGFLLAPLCRADGPQDIEMDTISVVDERAAAPKSAASASEGQVDEESLRIRPVFRTGQLLEAVPGLVATVHSGEGKANQFLLRGYNLDHGTDLAVSVDGMPVNEPTHAHGQGYADLNFVIPELVRTIDFTKGPYRADLGDFASVGSVRLGLRDGDGRSAQTETGTGGFRRVVLVDGEQIPGGSVTAAGELQAYDGPWTHPDAERKANLAIRYSQGAEQSLTFLYYTNRWSATTDQPQRAVDQAWIGRYGSLDPSDGGDAQRASLSARWSHDPVAGWSVHGNAFAIRNVLTLWNDFTHWLIDPIHGDQEAQHEDRTTLGGAVTMNHGLTARHGDQDLELGASVRSDQLTVSRLPTQDRQPIDPLAAPQDYREFDQAKLEASAIWIRLASNWSPRWRSTLAVREDRQNGLDVGTNATHARQSLLQPKATLAMRASDEVEIYADAGRGFHSDDLRGVGPTTGNGIASGLLARQDGAELGLSAGAGPDWTVRAALYGLQASSETLYDPDVGQTSAGPASRRTGVEVVLCARPRDGIEIQASASASHARFRTDYDDGTGHVGRHLPNAPEGDSSITVRYEPPAGTWGAGLALRRLGPFALTPDNAVRGQGYGEWNLRLSYHPSRSWEATLGIFNALDTRANAEEFWYIDRLPGEPASGVAGLHVHPLEPRAIRLGITLHS